MTYFPEHAEAFQTLLNKLKGQKVAVLGHMRPDGDCIGSQIGFCRVLRATGVDAVAVNRAPAPKTLKPFLADTPFLEVGDFEPHGYVAVQVDCADPIRVGQTLADMFPQPVAQIDHHISNPGFADINIMDASASATAEILAGLCFDAGLPVDAATAEAFYIGIATDTGQFRFPSTSQKVFDICSRLIRCGARPAFAAEVLYENESFAKLDLLQRFLSTLSLECEGRVCIGRLPQSFFTETGSTRDDAEGLVDYARAIQGVEIGLLLEDREDGLKGSFRSKDPKYRVDQLAVEFGGGGHACAAGFNQKYLQIDAFYPRIVAAIARHLQKIDS